MRVFPPVLQIMFTQRAQGSGKKNTAGEEEEEEKEEEEEMDRGRTDKTERRVERGRLLQKKKPRRQMVEGFLAMEVYLKGLLCIHLVAF